MRHCTLIVFFAVLAGCSAPTVDQFAWLSGGWSSEIDNVVTSERWGEPQGRRWMVGLNTTMRMGEETVIFSEFLRISADRSGITYVARPSFRDDPVEFRLVDSGPQYAMFENLHHDYPQRIIYRREGDILHARIEGDVNGQQRSREWKWMREEQ